MNKINITIELDGKVETIKADKLLFISENDSKFTLLRKCVGDSDGLGLLKIAEWHIEKDWKKSNE